MVFRTNNGNRRKKQYDGSYTFTIDATNKDYNNYVQVQKWWGIENITFNYFSLEFKDNFNSFDYKSYKGNFSYLINLYS